MRRITRHSLGLIAVAACILFVCWLIWPDADPVRERFHILQDGLTRADVEGVMGEPDGVSVIAQAVTILTYNGHDATGTILIDHATDRVIYTQWRPNADRIWLRWWGRVTAALGV